MVSLPANEVLAALLFPIAIAIDAILRAVLSLALIHGIMPPLFMYRTRPALVR